MLNENTMPSISLHEITKSKAPAPTSNEDKYPNAVKIIARVARIITYQDKPAMGIELLNLDGNDLVKWSNFIAKISKGKIVLPYLGQVEKPSENTPAKQEAKTPSYTLRFKTLDHAIRYLPSDTKGQFFIPSPTLRKNGDKVSILLIHPDNQSKLGFHGIVEFYGSNPKNEKIIGIFVRYENLTPDLKNQINTFLNHQLIS